VFHLISEAKTAYETNMLPQKKKRKLAHKAKPNPSDPSHLQDKNLRTLTADSECGERFNSKSVSFLEIVFELIVKMLLPADELLNYILAINSVL